MKVLVFGANGRLGSEIVAELLAQGHEVRGFVHANNSLPSHPRLEIVVGDVHDKDAVFEAMKGMEAVMSALGSAGAPKPDIATSGIRAILPAMEKLGLRRLVSVTGSAAYDVGETPHEFARVRHESMLLGAAGLLKDGEEHLRLLRKSTLDWTVVRVPMMNFDAYKPYELATTPPPPWAAIPYRSAAKAMVDLIASHDWLRAAPFVVCP